MENFGALIARNIRKIRLIFSDILQETIALQLRVQHLIYQLAFMELNPFKPFAQLIEHFAKPFLFSRKALLR